jgi:hypothetical protein
MKIVPKLSVPQRSIPQYWVSASTPGGGSEGGGVAGKQGPGGKYKAMKKGYNRYENQNSGA